MGEMVRAIKGLKDGNNQVETEFQQKYGNTGEPICPTDCTDGSLKYGRKSMYHKHGRMPSTKKETEQNVVVTKVKTYFRSRQNLSSDPIEKNIKRAPNDTAYTRWSCYSGLANTVYIVSTHNTLQ